MITPYFRIKYAAWIALSVVMGPVRADGLALYELGTPDLGLAAAGRAALAQDASTAFGNPAGMTRLWSSEILVGTQAIYDNTRFDATGERTFTGGDGGQAGGVKPAGSFFYVRPLTPAFRVGVAATSYFDLGVDYEDEWVGRYYVQRSQLATVSLSVPVAYRFNEWLSLGAGINMVYGNLAQQAAVNNVLDALPDGRIRVEDSDVGIGGIFGILIEWNPKTRVGLQYISQIELDFKDSARLKDIGPTLGSALATRGLLDDEIDFGVSVPHSVLASAYYELNRRWALVGNVGWQDWSSFGKTSVTVDSTATTGFTSDNEYRDTWHVALGAQFRFEDPWLLSFGFAYDTSPVATAERTPDAPLDRQYRLGAGLQYEWRRDLIIGLAYEYLDGGEADIEQAKGPLTGVLTGKYSNNTMHFFGANLQWRF